MHFQFFSVYDCKIKGRKVCLEMKYVFISIFYSFDSSFSFSNFLFYSLFPLYFFSHSFPIHLYYFTIITLFMSFFFARSGRLMKVIRKPNRFYYLFNLLIAHRTERTSATSTSSRYIRMALFFAIFQLMKSNFLSNIL